jgi:sugar phosphate isomerase/epimerase
LASNNKQILSDSVNLTQEAVEMCRLLDSPLYSFHAGYTCDFDYSFHPTSEMIPEQKAYEILKNNIQNLCDQAAQYDVNIAIENMNATLPFVLFNRWQDFEKFFRSVGCGNLGILIDIGHLKTASNLLNFNSTEFVQKMEHKLMEVHCHDNNARKDEHLLLKDRHALDDFTGLKHLPVTLERTKLEKDEVLEGKEFLESFKY